MPTRPVAAVLTLGCKLNLADSEQIARGLRAAGYHVVDQLCEAQAVVVNTCSVTHVADRKSRNLIRSVRRTAPDALVAVTGCFPRSAGFAAAHELGADFVTGTRDADKASLFSFLRERGGGCGAPAPADIAQLHARAFIKAHSCRFDPEGFCEQPAINPNQETTTGRS